ncbi:histidine kinase [Peteryoungia algae]|uniref:Histidine kinase n=1 Tax=Peteryoungia algae TaxID=2919917 RepID=A0ABT0D4P7_9HYPH|nr:histidine kinase [Rhizobium sp. SSM4.3]MCJ8240377.1 histidine kinase [Rhizobium sp. SSM4.3]
MNTVLAATAILLISATAPLAGSFTFPAGQPAATVEIPDDWQPTVTDDGIEGNSPDAGTYISFDIAGNEDMEQVMTDVFAFLEENGVTADPGAQKETEDELDGMPFQTIEWKGMDKDGPVSIGVGIVALSADGDRHHLLLGLDRDRGGEPA